MTASEAQEVLGQLLRAHPELRTETERMSRTVLASITIERVAGDLEVALRSLGHDHLRTWAGRHSWGYVEPTEAAWELLNEAAEPFLAGTKRLVGLGLVDEALTCCRGIVMALYGVSRTSGDQVLGMAPESPKETAAHAVAELVRLLAPGQRRRRDLATIFADEAPEWSEMLERVTRTP